MGATEPQGVTMRSLRCLFGRHLWHTEFNYETQGTERECSRCGAHVSTYPGDVTYNPHQDPRERGYGGIHGDTQGGGTGGGGS